MKKVIMSLLVIPGLLSLHFYLFGQSSTPQTYKLVAEAAASDQKAVIATYRDGSKERIEMTVNGSQMTTIFDFQAHKVYWINWFNSGRCSAGRYLSARVPSSQDFITGTAEILAQFPSDRKRKVIRPEKVNGIPARLEEFEGGAKPASSDILPTRIWFSEQGNFIVKLEGVGQDGKPATLFEVKQFSLDKPAAALFEPPANCPMTDSEMDERGEIRAHSETSINAQGTATADLGKGTVNSTVAASAATDKMQTPVSAPKITVVTLKAVELPNAGPCGRMLHITGIVTTDGPATIWYRFYANVGGVEFSGGQDGTITVAASGEAAMVKDVTFPISKRGELRLQAAVQGPTGRHGSAIISNVVPFEVTCGSAGTSGKH